MSKKIKILLTFLTIGILQFLFFILLISFKTGSKKKKGNMYACLLQSLSCYAILYYMHIIRKKTKAGLLVGIFCFLFCSIAIGVY